MNDPLLSASSVMLNSLMWRFPATKDDKIVASYLCWEDVRRMDEIQMAGFFGALSQFFASLKSMEGRTIKRVYMDSEKNTDPNSPDYNPLGTVWKLKVDLVPVDTAASPIQASHP